MCVCVYVCVCMCVCVCVRACVYVCVYYPHVDKRGNEAMHIRIVN